MPTRGIKNIIITVFISYLVAMVYLYTCLNNLKVCKTFIHWLHLFLACALFITVSLLKGLDTFFKLANLKHFKF